METEERRWEGRPDGQESAPSVDVGHEGYARSSIREETSRARQRVREKGAELEATAGRKVDELKESAMRKTDELTTRMGGRFETLARALRRAGDGMREEGEPRFAEMTDQAANRVERFGSYLEGQNPREMMQDIERSAQSHPAYFVAGTFAAGLLIGRFLRSGEPETSPRMSEEAR